MFFRKHWFFLAFLIVAICGVSLYLLHINTPKEPILIIKPVEPLEELTAETPVTETPTQGGHFHADGTWHEGPHETPPTAEKSEPVEKPPYLYDPDAKERPEGWDPDLVFDTGEKKIDLNYRPLTEEEQAEYEHLKATLVPPEDYGVTEAGLRIIAIGNIQRKNSPAFMESIEADIIAGSPREEIAAKLRTFSDIFAD